MREILLLRHAKPDYRDGLRCYIGCRTDPPILPVAPEKTAALSALLMCVTQNISNVLQSEQSLANKSLTLSISVGLSLYLGLFVPAGIGLYWIVGNLL